MILILDFSSPNSKLMSNECEIPMVTCVQSRAFAYSTRVGVCEENGLITLVTCVNNKGVPVKGGFKVYTFFFLFISRF